MDQLPPVPGHQGQAETYDPEQDIIKDIVLLQRIKHYKYEEAVPIWGSFFIFQKRGKDLQNVNFYSFKMYFL